MPRVAVVFTGGTISTAFDPIAGGNVPTLDGAAILLGPPGSTIAEVVPIDRGLTPASHFTFDDVLAIGSTVQAALDDASIDGVVVVRARTPSRRRASPGTSCCGRPSRSW